jgi:uncharacterized circularly permuted ATP-grasp superfamily protein/uncharacterized alpha-E superfamily protein
MTTVDNYISEASFDEVFDQNKTIRSHWSAIITHLEKAGFDGIESYQSQINWHLEDNGVTYNIYDTPEGIEGRRWSLDPIPFVITQEEWSDVAKGLRQRAKLLDMILRDLYGAQNLLKDNIIPAEIIFGHQGFSAELHSMGIQDNFHLYFYAADMARGPDGKMWVISDRAQAPSGLGYAIENRLTINAISQELFPGIGARKISGFIEEFKNLLKRLSHQESAASALLTPGSHNETYFEHALLSSFLEIHLVTGNDLLSKNGAIWLKSLGGLKRITTLLRRVDDRFCDPLELRSDSRLGVAGLVDVMRHGGITMINPIGSAALENIGLNPFMESICRYFLNEELLLPQIATWWCGQQKELDFVLENLDRLIIKKINPESLSQAYFGKNLSYEALQDLKEQLIQNPHQYVAQEEISFSTTPYYANRHIEPRNAVIRGFSLRKEDDYVVMDGGLVRVSAAKDAFLVSSKEGGTSKDLWVLGEPDKSDASNILKYTPYTDTSIRNVPTQKAENLYWLGRYVARSIITARLVRYVLKKKINLYRDEETLSQAYQEILQNALTHLTMTYPGFLRNDEEEPIDAILEIISVIKDTDRTGSLSFTISLLTNSHINVKSLLAIESWRFFDKMHKEWQNCIYQSGKLNSAFLIDGLDTLLIHLMAYKELIEESMFKEQGLIVFNIGHKIESALLLISKTRSFLCFKLDKSVGSDVLEGILNSCESYNSYRAQYKSALRLKNVIEFLIFNTQFPKSLIYLANEILEDFKTLPKSKSHLASYEEPIFRAYALLRLADVHALIQIAEEEATYCQLDQILSQLFKLFSAGAEEFSKTYFSHTDE